MYQKQSLPLTPSWWKQRTRNTIRLGAIAVLSLSVRFSQMAEKPRLQCRCPAFTPCVVKQLTVFTVSLVQFSSYRETSTSSCHCKRETTDLLLSQLRNNRGSVDFKTKCCSCTWREGLSHFLMDRMRDTSCSQFSGPSCTNTTTKTFKSKENKFLNKCKVRDGLIGVCRGY